MGEQRVKLNNISIYPGENALYVSHGDYYLVEIAGDDREILIEVLQLFKKINSPNEVFKLLTSSIEIELEHFEEIVQWLLDKKFLIKEELVAALRRPKIYVFSPSDSTDDIVRHLKEGMSDYEISSSLEEITKEDLLIFVSPIFDNYPKFIEMVDFCQMNDITSIHISMGSNYFTLGPVSKPSLRTPCLYCYSRRKIGNLSQPSKYLRFIERVNKKSMTNFDITEINIFKLLIKHLELLVTKLMENPLANTFYGRSATFDSFYYNVTKSKILKVNDCKICNQINRKNPFDI